MGKYRHIEDLTRMIIKARLINLIRNDRKCKILYTFVSYDFLNAIVSPLKLV